MNSGLNKQPGEACTKPKPARTHETEHDGRSGFRRPANTRKHASGSRRGCGCRSNRTSQWWTAQFGDGTWYVVDSVERIKTHDGYFGTRAEDEAELDAILAGESGPAANAMVA